jgi:predicted DNA-binding protein
MSEKRTAMHHLNLVLPEDLHQRLRAEADRTGRPATRIVRESVERYLEDVRRTAIHEAIASYAAAVAGMRDDLDPELEAAAVEFLRDGEAEEGSTPPTVREKPAKAPAKRRPAGRRARAR